MEIKENITEVIKKDIEQTRKNHRTKFFEIVYLKHKNVIDNLTHFLPINSTFAEKIYCTINNISSLSTCEYCGVIYNNFIDYKRGYAKYCCNSCKNKGTKHKRYLSILNKVGFKTTDDIFKDFKILNKMASKEKIYHVESIYYIYKDIIDINTMFIHEDDKKHIQQRVYCYLNGIRNIPVCRYCGKEAVKFKQFSLGYHEYCSTKCMSNAVKLKREQTNIKRHGVSNTFQSENSLKAIHEKYGYHQIHNSNVFDKIQSSGFKYKEYKMPSGDIRMVQGYENYALDILIKSYDESKIITEIKKQPKIIYFFEWKNRRHYLDIFIPKENRIIEVKSEYTFNKYKEKCIAKQRHCIEKGYLYEIWIMDKAKLLTVI